jgi:hypothetical protein
MKHTRPRSLALRLLALAATLALVACESSTTTIDSGVDAGGSDAGTEQVDAGSGGSDAQPTDAGFCDLSPEPLDIPVLEGRLEPLGIDGGTAIPATTGGDARGTWLFDSVTIYTGAATAGMYDAMTSSVTGRAWAIVDDTEARLNISVQTTLRGTAAGTIERPPSETRVRGSYTITDDVIAIEPTACFTSTTMPGAGTSELRFDAESGVLISRLSGSMGMLTLVFRGTRTAP